MPEIDTRHEERVEFAIRTMRRISHKIIGCCKGAALDDIAASPIRDDERVAMNEFLTSPAFQSLISEAVGEEREANLVACTRARQFDLPDEDIPYKCGFSKGAIAAIDFIERTIRARSEGEAGLAVHVSEAVARLEEILPEPEWQLVPKEPSEAMTDAAMAEAGMLDLCIAGCDADSIYRAMLAAAPPPPPKEIGDG